MGGYVKTRQPLRAIVLVMDCRRPFGVLDETLLEWSVASSIRWLALLTKADKLTHSERIKTLNQAKKTAKAWSDQHRTTIETQLFSANTGLGCDAASAWIHDALQ